MSVVQFPKREDNVDAVIGDLNERHESGQLKAVVCITIEDVPEGRKLCVLNGWNDVSLSYFDLLALSGALDQAKTAIQNSLEVS